MNGCATGSSKILDGSINTPRNGITAPILIIIGYKTKIAATLLGLFCLSTAFIFHLEFSNNMQVTSILKNVALSGGFLFIMINGAKKFSFDNMEKKDS